MKREYVKPMIAVEAFSANDYVAACYVVTCDAGALYSGLNHGTQVMFGKAPTPEADGDGFIRISGDWYYSGAINGHDPVLFEGDGLSLHPVTWKSGANGGAKGVRPAHPNASA